MDPKDTADQTVHGEDNGVTAAFSLGRGLGPCECPNCKADPQYAARVRAREGGTGSGAVSQTAPAGQ